LGDDAHSADGLMSLKERDGAMQWSWRDSFVPLTLRHYETFDTPEVLDRSVPTGSRGG
jgi:hypothetical protein